MSALVAALYVIVLASITLAALIGIELVQRRFGGRSLPVLRSLPTRRARSLAL